MKKFVLIVAVLLLSAFLCSCSVIQIVANVAQAARQSEIGARTPDGGYKNYWDEIPDTIPDFKYGTYDGKFSFKTKHDGNISYMMQYKGVTRQDMDDYAKALEGAGLDVSIMEYDDSYDVTGQPEDLSTFPPDDWSSSEGLPVPDEASLPSPFISADLDTSDGTCMVSVDIDDPSLN